MQLELSPNQPILEYHHPETGPGARWAMGMACMTTGMVIFMTAAVVVFILALRSGDPGVLALYPVGLILAVLGTALEDEPLRQVAIGGILGSVATSTAGYVVFLHIMTHP